MTSRLLLLFFIGLAVYIFVFRNREEISETASTLIAKKIHSALHESSPSGGGFMSKFGARVGAKVIKLEAGHYLG